MATSSIRKNFIISGQDQIDRFANAIEASYLESVKKPHSPSLINEITDSREISKIIERLRAQVWEKSQQ